jgi:hypothetical protein
MGAVVVVVEAGTHLPPFPALPARPRPPPRKVVAGDGGALLEGGGTTAFSVVGVVVEGDCWKSHTTKHNKEIPTYKGEMN